MTLDDCPYAAELRAIAAHGPTHRTLADLYILAVVEQAGKHLVAARRLKLSPSGLSLRLLRMGARRKGELRARPTKAL
jgi:hypothetical protein